MEEAICRMTDSFLGKLDPIQKAQRNLCSDKKQDEVPQETLKVGRNIQAQVAHTLHIRDLGKCRFVYSNGKRCQNKRWIEKHHIKPVSSGGLSVAENLVTLCSGHHKYQHAIQHKRGTQSS